MAGPMLPGEERKRKYTPKDAKLKKQLGYADTVGVRFAAILGEDELAQDQLTLKELESGEQARLGMAEAAARIIG